MKNKELCTALAYLVDAVDANLPERNPDAGYLPEDIAPMLELIMEDIELVASAWSNFEAENGEWGKHIGEKPMQPVSQLRGYKYWVGVGEYGRRLYNITPLHINVVTAGYYKKCTVLGANNVPDMF